MLQLSIHCVCVCLTMAKKNMCKKVEKILIGQVNMYWIKSKFRDTQD